MPRLPRIHVERGLYFVTSNGSRDALFRDDNDRIEYVGLLAKYKEQYKFKLHAYILTPGLTHLLIELDTGTTISEIMHALNSTYTKYYNARYERRGTLFQGRFKAAVVEKEKYMPEVSRAIHMLPVAEKIAWEPRSYKWSSYSTYLEGDEDAREILTLFSENKTEQIDQYKDFVESATESELKIFYKKIQNARIIGSKEFVQRLENGLEEIYKKDEEEISKKNPVNKIFIATSIIMVLIFASIAVYLQISNKRVISKVENILQKQEMKSRKNF